MNTEILKTVWKLVVFQILTTFLASGASIPMTIPSIYTTSNSAAAVNNVSNPYLIVRPSCIHPPGSYVAITIRTCQPALNELMLRPDSSRRVEYQWEGQAIKLTDAPCIIGLGCTRPCPDILLSGREIVGYAYRIIATCESEAMGWMQTDGSRNWLVVVTGAARGSAVVNATIGEAGNTTLAEDQSERYNVMMESS